MGLYIPVDLWHVKTGEWLAHIPMYDLEVTATSKPKVEYAAYNYIEQAIGLKAFHIIWREH